jgi:hypothetical protein
LKGHLSVSSSVDSVKVSQLLKPIMATAKFKTTTVLVGLLGILLAGPTIYNADLPRTVRVMGLFRQPSKTAITQASDFVVIADTPHCEDLHYHEPSGLLFTACQGDRESRYSWFPPLAMFENPSITLKSKGSLHVVDPKVRTRHSRCTSCFPDLQGLATSYSHWDTQTMKAQKLELENFEGGFVTHGIDVIPDPAKPEGQAVYVFAINHVANPAYYGETLSAPIAGVSDAIPKARSRIEVFHHEIGSKVARHVRSVWDPLIRTPNDVVALSPTSFLVTNDHFYREGRMRLVEDIHFGAKWTDTIHVQLDALSPVASDTEGVKATVALDHMHNNNGIGHGRTPNELLVIECTSGTLNIASVTPGGGTGGSTTPTITIEDSVTFDSIIDNPSYFADPFADAERDASSYLLPGLTRAGELHAAMHNTSLAVPVMVWSAKAIPSSGGAAGGRRTWETRLVFEDDGSKIRSASAAVQVALDRSERDRAWLFVTGFVSDNIIAVKVDV